MNKFIYIVGFILTSYLGLMYLPWYATALFAMIYAYLVNISPVKSIMLFFCTGFLIWFLYAYALDMRADSRLSERIAVLFGNQKVIIITIITGLIGGITAALGGWSGSSLKNYLHS
jgi:hypothetical protein